MTIKDQQLSVAIDYRECEKEPITMPGAIQSYGGLLVIERGEVSAYSKNLNLFLPIDPSNFLHKRISEALPELNELFMSACSQLAEGQTSFQNLGQWIVGFRRAASEVFYLEFFPQPTHIFDLKGLEDEVDHLSRKFHYPMKNRAEFLNDICHLFQKYLKFDQIFVQVFQEGEIIEVVAEANTGKIEAVIGLHFSSKEIPSQARDLYLKQLIRFKQASQDSAVDIVNNGIGDVNLTHSLLREPSKFMTIYMQNISASTLLSCSIVIEKQLTALITMHNAIPLLLDPRSFDSVVKIVQKISLELLRIDYLIEKNANSKLWELLTQNFPLDRLAAIGQLITSPKLERSVDHSGAVVTKDGKIFSSIGECPIGEALGSIIQKALNVNGPIYFSSNLEIDLALPAILLGDFAGALIIKFEDICIFFFRKNFHLELKWRSSVPTNTDEVTNLPRFSPGGSFQFFIEEFANQSRPWTEKDIAFAKVIANWISEDFES